MRLTEAIKKLHVFLEQVGDVEFICISDVDGSFHLEWDNDFELIEIPWNDSKNKKLVCAFMDPLECSKFMPVN